MFFLATNCTNFQKQFFPPLSHINSVLRYPSTKSTNRRRQVLERNTSSLASSPKNDLPFLVDLGESSSAVQSCKRLFDAKQKTFIIDQLLTPMINSKSGKFKIELVGKLLLSEGQSFELCSTSNFRPSKLSVAYNAKKDTIKVNGQTFKLLQQRNSPLFQHFAKRNLQIRSSQKYTGIGSLNKRYMDNRSAFSAKLGSIFSKKEKIAESDKLKVLLSDDKLTDEERQRLKVTI